MANITLDLLLSVLAKPIHHEQVVAILGENINHLERMEYYGFIILKEMGADIVFNEAPWVVPASEIRDPSLLYVAAVHLYRQGYRDYGAYEGALPHGISFGMSESEIVQRLGQPDQRGVDKGASGKSGRWMMHRLGDYELNAQFDESGKLRMVTLGAPRQVI